MTFDQEIELLQTCALSDWEKNFCESIKGSFKRYGSLTPKQEESFNRILSKFVDDNGNKKVAPTADKKKFEASPKWLAKQLVEKLAGDIREDAMRLLEKLEAIPLQPKPAATTAPSMDDLPF